MRLKTAAWLVVVAALGCDSVSQFRGNFQGDIVPGAFVRSCFGDTVRARLEYEPRASVAGIDAPPSLLSTDDGTFDRTPLLPIAALASDSLSDLEFPGNDRLRNYLLMARPEGGPLVGRDVLVVVSLLENKRIELRIIARSEDDSAQCATPPDAGVDDDGPRQFFGIFSLKSSS